MDEERRKNKESQMKIRNREIEIDSDLTLNWVYSFLRLMVRVNQYRLMLNFNKHVVTNMVRKFNHDILVRLPNIEGISIIGVTKQKDLDIIRFLKYSFPRQIESFNLIKEVNSKSKIAPIKIYSIALQRVIPNVTKILRIK